MSDSDENASKQPPTVGPTTFAQNLFDVLTEEMQSGNMEAGRIYLKTVMRIRHLEKTGKQ